MAYTAAPTDRSTISDWAHTHRWLGAESLFKAGQRFHVSIDYVRQRLTVPPEYDDARARERAERSIELKAQSDQLRSVWRAQITGR